MLLHNQTSRAIVWDDGPQFSWEPFGSCEVPDRLVPHLLAARFPVGHTPIAREVVVQREAEEALDAAKRDEMRVLRTKLEAAEAQHHTSAREAERLAVKLEARTAELERATLEIERLTLALAEAERAAGALRATLAEQAGQVADAQIEAERARGEKRRRRVIPTES